MDNEQVGDGTLDDFNQGVILKSDVENGLKVYCETDSEGKVTFTKGKLELRTASILRCKW